MWLVNRKDGIIDARWIKEECVTGWLYSIQQDSNFRILEGLGVIH